MDAIFMFSRLLQDSARISLTQAGVIPDFPFEKDI